MSLSERLRTSLLQMWLRIRYAEHVGTRLTRHGFRLHLPGVFLQFGTSLLFGAILGAGVVDQDFPLAMIAGSLFLLFLLSGVTVLRMLVGYLRSARYPVVLDLWSDRGPQPEHEVEDSPAWRAVLWSEPSRVPAKRPLFHRIDDVVWVVLIWLLSVLVWVVAALLLHGLIVGDFPGGGGPLGEVTAEQSGVVSWLTGPGPLGARLDPAAPAFSGA